MSAQGPFSSPLFDPGFGLIETLLWTPEAGFWLEAGHFARLAASAAAFGFDHDPTAVSFALTQGVYSATTPSRVRLVLSRDGAVEVTRTSFAPAAPHTIWSVGVA